METAQPITLTWRTRRFVLSLVRGSVVFQPVLPLVSPQGYFQTEPFIGVRKVYREMLLDFFQPVVQGLAVDE